VAVNDRLPFSPACERNRVPIRDVLVQVFGDCTDVLEIGSGTGQHAVFLAASMPWLVWRPTDFGEYLPGLAARVAIEGPANCRAPEVLDVRRRPWPVDGTDAIFSANTLHIMAWSAVRALFAGLAGLSGPPRILAIYGPFRYAGRCTSDSNARFDASLRARDPASGIRDFEAVDALAREAGFELQADHAMPANNQLIVWRRARAAAGDG